MYVTAPHEFQNAPAIAASVLLAESTGTNANSKTIEAGSMIFCEGDESKYVYEIVEGVVRSSKFLCDGRRQVVSFGYPGDLVGISHDCRYHSDCDAISAVKVRIHLKNACSADMATDPVYCDRLLRQTVADMNNMQEHFMMLGRKSALEKVASFLHVLSKRVGVDAEGVTAFDLPMSRTDIGDFLGLSIETVSRTLTKLRKCDVIDLPTPHRVRVLRPSRLAEHAERDD